MNFLVLLSPSRVCELTSLLTTPVDDLEGSAPLTISRFTHHFFCSLTTKESLQTCALWLKNEGNLPEVVLTVLRLLDRLHLTSSQVISSGIGTTVMKLRKQGTLFPWWSFVHISLNRCKHGAKEPCKCLDSKVESPQC